MYLSRNHCHSYAEASWASLPFTCAGGDADDEWRRDLPAERKNMTSTALQIDDLSVTTAGAALTALDRINSSISLVTQGRGKVGAVQNRLVRTIANQSIAVENLTAAESGIRDADIAEEVLDR